MLAKINRRHAWPTLSRPEWTGLNRFFEDIFNESPRDMVACQNIGSLDLYEDETHLHIEAELPGFNKDQISLTLEDGVLNLQGERSQEEQNEENEKNHYYVRERSYGSWARSIRLPVPVQEENVQASFDNGVLKISLAKQEQKKTHRIEVK